MSASLTQLAPADASFSRATRDRRAVPFAAALTLALTALWIVAAIREGSWSQELPWDQAWFHTIALRLKRSLAGSSLAVFARDWIEYSKTHAPLVPTVSALLMLVFGESRHVAEAVLPLSTFVLVLSVFRVTERLYDRGTAYAASALACGFPIAITLSRTYLFEHTLAALVAASFWAMLASEGFSRLRPTLAFGALAGLSALARTGGPMLLIGPTVVYTALALRREGAGRRARNFALATALGAAIAAPWYVPNLKQIVAYIHSVTYGEHAAMYAGGGSGISLENIRYYLVSIVIDGPGVPMAALAVIAYVAGGGFKSASAAASPTMLAIVTAFAIEFAILLLASQRVGAVLFLPVMPMLALMIVRAVRTVPWRALRWTLGLGVAACALHHVVAMTFTFPVPQGRDYGRGPFALGFDFEGETNIPLWNHRLMWLDMAESVGKNPRADYHVREVVDRLESLDLPATANVYVLSDHPFFQVNSLRLEATRRGYRWTFNFKKGVAPDYTGAGSMRRIFRSNLNAADAFVTLDRGVVETPRRAYSTLTERLIHPDARRYSRVGAPIDFEDESQVSVYGRAHRPEVRDDADPKLTPVAATFGEPGDPLLTLEGISFESLEPDDHLFTACFRWDRPTASFPEVFIHFLTGGQFLRAYAAPARLVDAKRLAGAASKHVVVRIHIEGEIPDIVRARGFEIAMGVLTPKDAPPELQKGSRPDNRLPVQSSLPTDDEGTRVYVLNVPPSSSK